MSENSFDDKKSKINHTDSARQLEPETGARPENATKSHIDIINKKLLTSKIASSVQERLTRLIASHQSVFASSDDDIGKFTATDGGLSTVSFHLKEKTKVCYAIPRRVPHGRRRWLEERLEQLEKTGIIEEVTHSNEVLHVSPVVIVPKKNNKFRMAIDYRELNSNLQLETMPLPNVKDCVEKLARKRFFSALDLLSAYHQLELSEETKLLCFLSIAQRV